MKKIVTIIAFLALLIPTTDIQAQMLSESAKRKFTVGVDIFTDIWMVTKQDPFVPAGYENRTINQGANVFFMYNLPFKPEKLSGFSIGLAIRNQNSYSNSVIVNIKSTDIVFNVIEDLPHPDRVIPLSYKRSKINLTYLDLPAEVKFRTEGGFKVGIGLKVGYLIDSKQKYVGEWPVAFSFTNPEEEDVQYNAVNDKQKKINQLEKWTYGATLRIGYKWISVFGYYQFNKIFISDRGPEMQPISVGLTITPF
jgi:hypothetical protein